MVNEVLKAIAKDQSEYMDAILVEANDVVETLTNPVFDPQGRILVEIPYVDETSHVTTSTTVSLDVEMDKGLEGTFIESVVQAMPDVPNTNIEDQPKRKIEIVQHYLQQPRGSVISLQEEFHFHLALASRVYEKAFTLEHPGVEKAHKATMIEVNKQVMNTFAAVLVAEYKKGKPFNIAKINKVLDKARKEILPKAHTLLMKNMVLHAKAELYKLRKNEQNLKHIAEETPATPNDILYIEQDLATLVKGTEYTSHHREQGGNFAHRQIMVHPIKNGKIVANKNAQIQIRTPSPVVKAVKGYKFQNYANDVKLKLEAIRDNYKLAAYVSPNSGTKAFIYNSLTALNDRLDDLRGKNLQTESAQHILGGAHQYNASQLRKAEKNVNYTPVLCFVQNISVNGYGDRLGYGNTWQRETTLMAEIAMLHTLKDSVGTDSTKIDKIIDKYKAYLQSPEYISKPFSSTALGKEAIKDIKNLKNEWKKSPHTSLHADETVLDDAKNALKTLMAYDLPMRHDFAKLTQTLSLFCEEIAMGGCKSGNERAQAIYGRVELFQKLLNSSVDDKLANQLRTDLSQLAKGKGDVLDFAKNLKHSMDTSYNAKGLQGAMKLVSFADQGAAAKVEARSRFSLPSRNIAEESASVMTNLHQSKAGKMQAHKDLTTQMRAAWFGHPKSWWEEMKGAFGGHVGALLATVTVLPALWVTVKVASNNEKRMKSASTLCAIPAPANGSSRVMAGMGGHPEDTNARKEKKPGIYVEPKYPNLVLKNRSKQNMDSSKPNSDKSEGYHQSNKQ
ncbi:MAG: hypothetical protein WC785_02695 [Tatlockia sp.]|jgi:hypothetical protein